MYDLAQAELEKLKSEMKQQESEFQSENSSLKDTIRELESQNMRTAALEKTLENEREANVSNHYCN